MFSLCARQLIHANKCSVRMVITAMILPVVLADMDRRRTRILEHEQHQQVLDMAELRTQVELQVVGLTPEASWAAELRATEQPVLVLLSPKGSTILRCSTSLIRRRRRTLPDNRFEVVRLF